MNRPIQRREDAACSERGASRALARTIKGAATSDGDGVKLRRLIGGHELPMLDPFLMLDCFGSDQPLDYIRGFPDHPHRGFETVTYMLAGRMRHKDSAGHAGLIGPGDAQWITAGRGIVHSEMPEQHEGLLKGFQLWVNLPAAEKMKPPAYCELAAGMIPHQDGAAASVKVLAGTTDLGTTGPITGSVDPMFFDVHLSAGARFSQTVPRDHNGFLYVIEGGLRIGPEAADLERETLGVMGPGEHISVEAGEVDTRFLLVAGRAIREPVARSGPFVMTTRQELMQAYQDFQNGDI